jgi:hypothetical protein
LFAGAAIPAHEQFPRNSRGNDSSAWPRQSQVNDTKIVAPCASNRPAATASLKSDANELSNPFRANASLKSEASGLSHIPTRETIMSCRKRSWAAASRR